MATDRIPERVVASDDTLYGLVGGCILEKDVGARATWVMRWLWQRLDPFVEGRKLGITVPEMRFVLDAITRLKRRPDLEIDYRGEPRVPLTPEQAAWADKLLREKGLRSG